MGLFVLVLLFFEQYGRYNMEFEGLTSSVGYITPNARILRPDGDTALLDHRPLGGSAQTIARATAKLEAAAHPVAAAATCTEVEVRVASSLPLAGVDGARNPVVSQLAVLHAHLDTTAGLIEALLFPRAGPATHVAQEVVQELQAEKEEGACSTTAPPALLAALHRSEARAAELAAELSEAREVIAAHEQAAEEHAGQLGAACTLVEANEEVLRVGRGLRARAQREGWGGEEEEGGEGERPPKRAREGAALPSPPPEQGSELVRRAALAAAALKAAREEAREKASAVAVQHAMALQALKREHAAELAAARSGRP